jgi:hypothetical protein
MPSYQGWCPDATNKGMARKKRPACPRRCCSASQATTTAYLVAESRDVEVYGRQFEVHTYTTVLPATIQGLRRYLGSGLIKGIGPKMAERAPVSCEAVGIGHHGLA